MDTTSGRATKRLSIDFANSLRLLTFQDLIALFESCKRKRIIITNMKFDKIFELFSTAVETSVANNNDPRLLSNCKNVDGQPYTISILSLDNMVESENGVKTRLMPKAQKQIQEGPQFAENLDIDDNCFNNTK